MSPSTQHWANGLALLPMARPCQRRAGPALFALGLAFLAVVIISPLMSRADPLPPATLSYDLLQEAPHDRRLFTQGLLVDGEDLIETSGGYGQSLIRRYNAESGKIQAEARLPRQVFAEGVAQVKDQLWVLSWQNGVALKLNAEDLSVIEHATYSGEGWGLAFDGEQLIMSDGSDKLTLRHPGTFAKLERRRVSSTSDGKRRTWQNLNELEYAHGLVWANVWQDSNILAIDPATGIVRGILDLADLVAKNNHQPGHSVLNGIAYDPAQEAFWVTGKLWPRRYLLKVHWPESADRPDATSTNGTRQTAGES